MNQQPFSARQFVHHPRLRGFAVSNDGAWFVVEVATPSVDEKVYRTELRLQDLGDPKKFRSLTPTLFSAASPKLAADGTLYFIARKEASSSPCLARLDLRDSAAEPQLFELPQGESVHSFALCDRGIVALITPNPADASLPRTYTKTPIRVFNRWMDSNRLEWRWIAFDGAVSKTIYSAPSVGLHDVQWDLSRDGKSIVTTRSPTGGDLGNPTELLWIDVESGAFEKIAADPESQYRSPRISPDGQTVAFFQVKDQRGIASRQAIQVFERSVHSIRPVQFQEHPWIVSIAWTADGNSLLVQIYEQGHRPLYRVSLRNPSENRVLWRKGVFDLAYNAGDRVFGVCHSIFDPPEVVSFPFGDPSQITKHTELCEPAVRAIAAQLEMRESWVNSDDGTPVHCFEIGPRSSKKLPALLMFHGGPVDALGDLWHWRWNPVVFAAMGYRVIVPHFRGTPGYGHDFIQGVWGNRWGEKPFEDTAAIVNEIRKDAKYDSDRLCGIGPSYGGYFVNLLAGKTDWFKCVVSLAGIYDLRSFGISCDFGNWWSKMSGLDPRREDDCRAIDLHSPHAGMNRWKAPALIFHGDTDYRVPLDQGIALFQALQLRGVPSEFVIFPGEGHWIEAPRNVEFFHAKIEQFLKDRLWEQSTTSAPHFSGGCLKRVSGTE